MQTGKYVTLYSYVDGLKNRYYIKESSTDVPYELLYGIYENAQTEKVVDRNTFQSQLNQLVFKYKTGNETLIRLVQNASYKENDMVQVAASINGDTKSSIEEFKPRNKPFRFFVGAALTSSTLTTSVTDPTDYLYGTSPVRSIVPKIDVGIDAFTNPGVGRIFFRLELSYSVNNYTVTGTPNPLYNEVNPEVGQIKIKQTLLAVSPQIIYNIYNASDLKVFLDAGFAMNFASYPTRDYVLLKGGKPTTDGYELDKRYFNGFYAAVQLKAGVVLAKRYEIYAANYLGTGMTANANQNMNIKSYQLGLNYFIGKLAK